MTRATRRPRRRPPCGALVALALIAACGGGQTRFNLFSTDWEDDGGASIARVWQRIGSFPIPASADVVVGIGGHADKMIGMPLDGTPKWTFEHALDARPVITGNVVVASGADEAFALDAKSGVVLWRRPTGGIPLLGAGDDGTVTVVTFRRSGAVGCTLLAVTHDGQVVRQIETERALGAPAVLGRMAFVPWAGQYISVVDLSNGDETARVTLRDETSRAWTQDGSLWFGQTTFIHFDPHIREASKGKASSVGLPPRELPGSPKLMPSGNTTLPPVATAEDKAHIYARPAASDAGATIEDGRWYATYFRLAMGFTSDKGSLAWTHVHGSEFVGGMAAHGGIVLCDVEGNVTELDAKTGGVLAETQLGEPLKECVVNVDARHAGGSRRSAPLSTKPLAEQLSEAVRVDDPQLVSAQKLLLGELAILLDDLATKTLVDAASDPRTSPELLAAARAALAKRRNGSSYMEAALERHYDFLSDVLRPPPVGPIAQALGAMKETRAAPLLAAHLLDPADTNDDVKQAAAALEIVAGPDQLPALHEFFAMYRANADDDDIATAVVSTGKAMLALGDKSTRTLVEGAAKDASTASSVRDGLSALLTVKTGK